MRYFIFLLFFVFACKTAHYGASKENSFQIIAYYNGDGTDWRNYRWAQLDQVIYSFCHLKGNKLVVDNESDSLVIRTLSDLKGYYPKLKVLLSLGGWGGCQPCSEVFSTPAGRLEFALSVKALMKVYGVDGIDLDWEYPAIEGYPGHPFKPEDRQNFTDLVTILRKKLGKHAEISFAAGGFDAFFKESVDWAKVMPLVNRVNLMTYDLTNGYSKVTGHHTPLYSNATQQLSVDYGVRYLRSLGVPAHKIVIGAAFYARTWTDVANVNHGLYQSGKFRAFLPYDKFEELPRPENGFVFYRDSVSQAPYAYSVMRGEFATFDDAESVKLKTSYARTQGLGGIMFWQLGCDKWEGGLLEAIYKTRE